MPRSIVTKFHTQPISTTLDATWFPSARYIIRACVPPIYLYVTPLYRRDRAREAPQNIKNILRVMRTIYQLCEKRGFIVVIKSRRKKKKEKDHCSSSFSPSPSLIDAARPRGNSSLIKIFILQRLFPITSSDAVTLFARCRRYRVHIVASGENRVTGSACALAHRDTSRNFLYISVATTYPRMRGRLKMFSLLFSTSIFLFYTRNFRETRKRDFCESDRLLRKPKKSIGDASGKRKEGWRSIIDAI